MPVIRRTITAATQDALANLKFATQGVPALVTIAISAGTAGEDFSFTVDSNEFVAQAEINLEVANQVIDMERDVVMLAERVPAGQYFLSVPVVTTDVSFTVIIDPIVATPTV